MNWLDKIYEETNESKAITTIKDKIGWMVFSDDRAAVRTLMDELDVSRCFDSSLLEILAQLKPMKSRLENYEPFFKSIKAQIRSGDNYEELRESLESYR